ncbi:YqcC family protein [Rheinheimera muenzenbergensis]|uniref:YqcC family protein n=1 Tax=Rheinheimera muenzenbergensis TaxID=1193628 RepID=A0ABU8C7X0_9GAMM
MSDAVKTLLIELETELKQQQLWSAMPPDAEAMASTLPFCCDTLLLEQWLQFIFLPRLHALLDAQLALPNKIGILPIAEQTFSADSARFSRLLAIIGRIDKTLSAAV